MIVAWEDDRFDPDPLWTGHTPAAGEAPSGTDPDNWQILAAVRADSATWSAPVKVSAATDVADRHPSVIADRDGAFVAIWESKALQSSGANLSLRSSRSGDGGQSWSTFVPSALDANAMSQRARLSTDADGTVRAVWYDRQLATGGGRSSPPCSPETRGGANPRCWGAQATALGRRPTRVSSRSPVTARPSAPSGTSLIRSTSARRPNLTTSRAPAMVRRRATVAAAGPDNRCVFDGV